MAIGAGVGALAGFVVYGVKTALSKERTWSWRDAAAHAAGGVVGGALFPPLVAGLGAVGLPAGAAYVISGGLAWGGIWSLAQDATSWALGRADGLGTPRKYLVTTAVGLGATALLLPLASRAIGPAGSLGRHAGSVEAFIAPPNQQVTANVLKAEAEFLAYGALTEGASAGGVALTAVALGEPSAPAPARPTPPLRPSLSTSPEPAQAVTSSLFQDLGRRRLAPAEDAPAPDQDGLVDALNRIGTDGR